MRLRCPSHLLSRSIHVPSAHAGDPGCLLESSFCVAKRHLNGFLPGAVDRDPEQVGDQPIFVPTRRPVTFEENLLSGRIPPFERDRVGFSCRQAPVYRGLKILERLGGIEAGMLLPGRRAL
jgi:hypothetical protein